MTEKSVSCICPVSGKHLTWVRIKEDTLEDVGDASMLGSLAETWALYSPALVARYRQAGEEPLKEWLHSLRLEEVLTTSDGESYNLVQLEDVTHNSILVVGLAF